MIGPPTEPETCFNESGTSTGLMKEGVNGVALTRVLVINGKQLFTEGGQKFEFDSFSDCMLPGRAMKMPSPCIRFVPDLVTMLMAEPAVHPNSEEKAFVSTDISCTAPR